MNFTERMIELARRKERLIGRAEGQRGEIAAAIQRWEKPIGVVDRGIAVARFLRAHPLLLAGAAVAAAVLGRRNLVRWLGRGWVTWRTWRALGNWVRRFNA